MKKHCEWRFQDTYSHESDRLTELEANSEHLEISWECLADFLDFSLVGMLAAGDPWEEWRGEGKGEGAQTGCVCLWEAQRTLDI